MLSMNKWALTPVAAVNSVPNFKYHYMVAYYNAKFIAESSSKKVVHLLTLRPDCHQ